MMNQNAPVFHFRAAAMDRDAFNVVRFQGEEALSSLLRFEIDLISKDAEIDLEKILLGGAYLQIEKGDQMRRILGVISEFEQQREGPGGWYYYRAVLSPRLWFLNLSRQNQIYQNKTVPDIIAEELYGGAPEQALPTGAMLTAEDYTMLLERTYPESEYTVQYRETDFNFISRLMEHQGIFYFFVHDEGRDKIIFCDANLHLPALEEPYYIIPYRPPSQMTPESNAIQRIFCKNGWCSKAVVLRDYNYRLPHIALVGEALVEEQAHGLISEYGDHFKTPEEGAVLANIRAEEIRCRKKMFSLLSDCCLLQPGFRFKLEAHFRSDFNIEYFPVRLQHWGEQPLPEQGLADESPDQAVYHNEGVCIPSDMAFRPARVTPKPKIHGIMNAHVDTSVMKKRAEIDEQGRYKLIMPFDLSGKDKGRATRYVRMAQPYGGSRQGVHFPLLAGAEVIWTCIDGDPDRPIIIGVPPNPMNPSVVTSINATRNTIRTTSGIFMEFDDGVEPEDEETETEA